MIDTTIYLTKLRYLRKCIYSIIDGVPVDISACMERIQVDYEMKAINSKPTETVHLKCSITEHAYERAKERLSMNRGSFGKLAERAYLNGVGHSDTCGSLNRYITATYMNGETANNIKLFGENIFLFNGRKLITVYQLPNNLRKAAIKAQKTLH